jgi:glycosyltransferase involved in cell wall biosynthesis
MGKPLVSICIPTRNTERWLGEAVDSALGQIWGACEVIVVDDGSTDGTAEILKSYGDKIVYRVTEPRGGNPARNLAASLARGEWIQFLDADDYLLPDKIERQFDETGTGSGLDLILSPELLQRWSDGKPLEPELKPVPQNGDLFAQWLGWEMPGTQGGLWRADCLRRIGGWNEAMPCCQDYELYARALRQGVPTRWTSQPGSVYRIWSEQTVCRRDPLQLIEYKTKLIDEMADFLRESGRWNEDYRQIAGRTCFEMCRTFAQRDLAGAAVYHRGRVKRGMLEVSGPSAPLRYRVAYRLLGFKASERLAGVLR